MDNLWEILRKKLELFDAPSALSRDYSSILAMAAIYSEPVSSRNKYSSFSKISKFFPVLKISEIFLELFVDWIH